jgi:cysteine desulfurase/selenocysteine lyase
MITALERLPAEKKRTTRKTDRLKALAPSAIRRGNGAARAGIRTVEVEETVLPDFNIRKVRRDFPILQRKVYGKRLVYLDNAATTQKPKAVFDALARYYAAENANVHRGIHHLSEVATRHYEEARETVRGFLNANEAREVIFVRGTTEAINLVAQAYGRKNIGPGDEIIITEMEHHANIVPWQMLCEEKGAVLRVAPISDTGEILLDKLDKLFTRKTKLVAVAHVSNVLGTINPVRSIIRMAHDREIPVLVDGAQAVSHLEVDVLELGCDFYAFSGHKLYGPTGIGVLYARAELLDAMPPWQGGGDMIRSVSFEKTTYNELPYKFEAGTPPIAGAVGLAAAIDYVRSFRREQVLAHERQLTEYATQALSSIKDLRIIGQSVGKVGVLSFVFKDIHAHDIGTILDQEGIAVRAGHHCAQPLIARMKVPAAVRASLAMYNTREEVDALVEGIQKVRRMFR